LATAEQAGLPYRSPTGLAERLLAQRIAISWEVALLAGLLAIGLIMRMWDLGDRALHHDESLHAYFSWLLYDGRGYEHNPLMHGPFLFHSTALMYFLFGDSDFTARVFQAVVGTGLIALPFFFRKQLGTVGWITAALFLAFSPSILYYSRFARNEVYILFAQLAIVICMFRYMQEQKPRYLYIIAGMLCWQFVSKEVSFINAAILMGYLAFMVSYDLAKQSIPGDDFASRRDRAVVSVGLTLVAWLFVMIWPLIPGLRKNAGWKERPASADLLIVVGTLTVPQFAAGIEIVLEWLGVDIHQPAGGIFASDIDVGTAYGFFVVPLLLIASVVVGVMWKPKQFAIAAAIFYVPYTLLYTTFFTNIDGFGSGIWGSLDYWLDQQSVERGSQPDFYYGMMLPLYEYLPVVFSLVGIVWFTWRGDRFSRFLVYWLVVTGIAYSVAGEKMPWLTTHIALPAIILAAYAIQRLATVWKGASEDLRRTVQTVGGLLLLSAAATVLLIFLPYETGWNVLRLAIGALLVGCVALGVRQFGRPSAALLVPAVVFGGLFLLTVRTGWVVTYIHVDEPQEPLIYVQTSARVPELMEQIDEVAAATGKGHDLRVLVDSRSSFTWPWAWYLRDYGPSFQLLDGVTLDTAYDVVLANANNARAVEQMADLYTPGERYEHRWWFPEDYKGTTWESFKESLTDSAQWAFWWDFFIHRESPRPLGSEDGIAFFPAGYVKGQGIDEAAAGEVVSVDSEGRVILGRLGSRHGSFLVPADLNSDAEGNIYVADSRNLRIEKFDTAGNYLLTFEAPAEIGPFSDLWGLGVAPDGTVFAADTWNHRIVKFAPDGTHLQTWGQPAAVPDPGPYDLFGPRDIAIDPDGNLWVTDTGNNRLLKFSPDGESLGTYGSKGSGPGQFSEPVGLAISESGELFVADAWNRRVQVLDLQGSYLREFPVEAWGGQDPADKPYLALTADGNVLLSEPAFDGVSAYNQEGGFIGTLRADDAGEDALGQPYGVLPLPDGTFWVAEGEHSWLRQFRFDELLRD
jgi:predicted membrane-bound mannosyltransferase/sugar lactone lactonase YvrE